MATYLLALLVVSGANPPEVSGTNPLKLIHDELPNGELVREDYVPQPGDIVLFQTGHVAARVLCHLILCGQATHVGIVVTRADGTLGILETPTVGANVAINDLADQIHHYNGAVWVRRRTQNITRNQSERLSRFAQAQVGKPYDFGRLALMPLLRPLQLLPKSPIEDTDPDSWCWFCSSLVISCCAAADLIDPGQVRPCFVCPTDLMNDCLLDLSVSWSKPIRCEFQSQPMAVQKRASLP